MSEPLVDSFAWAQTDRLRALKGIDAEQLARITAVLDKWEPVMLLDHLSDAEYEQAWADCALELAEVLDAIEAEVQ